MRPEIHKRWTGEDIAKLKSLAQKQRLSVIAAELGRSRGATAVKAHQLRVSLKMPPKGGDRNLVGADSGSQE